MTRNDKKKIAELEKDIKKMQKDHRRTFAEFDNKKSSLSAAAQKLKKLFIARSASGFHETA